MSSGVGTIVVGGFPLEKEAIVVEEIGGQHSSSAADPVHANRILPVESLVIYACNCIVYLRIGFEWSYSCI
jgi:hypothetical protein